MLPRWNFQTQVNTIGGMVFLILGIYLTWDFTRSNEVPVCSARFGVPTQMSFQKADGSVLSPPEFQARVGIDERGVIEKTRMTRVIGDKPLLLNIALGGPSSEDTGVRFGWTLPGIDKASGACLVYNVLVPSDFNFANGGKLPGLVSQSNGPVADDDVGGFHAALSWNDQGNLTQFVEYHGSSAALIKTPNLSQTTAALLHRGKWVRIEQEVVLNRPDATDGILRLWVDGRLVSDSPQIGLRPHGGLNLKGMLADIGYFASHLPGDRRPTNVQFTPPMMSWK